MCRAISKTYTSSAAGAPLDPLGSSLHQQWSVSPSSIYLLSIVIYINYWLCFTAILSHTLFFVYRLLILWDRTFSFTLHSLGLYQDWPRGGKNWEIFKFNKRHTSEHKRKTRFNSVARYYSDIILSLYNGFLAPALEWEIILYILKWLLGH